MVRQCLNEASSRTTESMWAQGFGRINSLKAVKCAETYVPHVTLVPPSLNLVRDCPYLAPLCDQPLIKGGLPISLNVTVLNGLGVLGYVSDIKWAGSTSVKVEAQTPSRCGPSPGPSVCRFPQNLIQRCRRLCAVARCASRATRRRARRLLMGRWVPYISVEIINKPDKKKRLLWTPS